MGNPFRGLLLDSCITCDYYYRLSCAVSTREPLYFKRELALRVRYFSRARLEPGSYLLGFWDLGREKRIKENKTAGKGGVLIHKGKIPESREDMESREEEEA